VAINGFLIAGFQQDVVFDHALPENEKEGIASLFRSLYFELTTPELARLHRASHSHPWFPIQEVMAKFHIRWSDNTEKLCDIICQLPIGFQNYCSEKKWGFGDFQPLVAANGLILSPFLMRMMDLNLSRSQSVAALELVVDLLLLSKQPRELLPEEFMMGDAWLERLRHLRYPESSLKDEWASRQVQELPWPGTAQARWTRQGDRTGIELKLFVSQPTDLKKYLQSLSVVQDALEKDGPWKKH
jgi:hypothetical protein